MSLIRDQFCDGGLEYADVPAYSVSEALTLNRTMTSPVQQTPESPGNERHWQALGETEKKHAQPRSQEAPEQDLLPSDPVAESAPENATDALHEGE